MFVTLLFFPQSIHTSTKVLYRYIDNIGRLQHRLPRLGLVGITFPYRGAVRALTVVQECIRLSENLEPHLPTAYSEHSLRALPEVRDFPGKLNPTLSDPLAICQGWEDIDHSLRHGFQIGLMKPERYPVDK